MKKFFIKSLILLLLLSLSFNATAYIFKPPYASVDGGRLAQNMPEIFSVETARKIMPASGDFVNSEEILTNLSRTSRDASWFEVTDVGIKITKTDSGENTRKTLVYKYEPQEGFIKGEMYAFTCRIKTEGIAGGAIRNGLEAWSTKWLDQTHGYDGKNNMTGDNDWYEMTQFLKIPQGTTNLHLTLNMNDNVTGTAYFDDIKLYKVARDPMESVLLKPNYKGLIYGDGVGDISLNVLVYEQNDFYDFRDLALSVKLVDENDNIIFKSEPNAVNSLTNFVFSSEGLAVGDYYLQTELTNKADGEVLSKKEHTIRKRDKNYRPGTYIDENGHLIRDGKKTVLKRLGGYNAKYQETAEAALSMNVDSLSHYGLWWATGDYPNEIQYMRDNGMTTHICLSTYWFSDLSGNEGTKFIKQQSDILSFFTQIAEKYKDDSVLEAYYLYDEPDPVTKGEEIRWNNEILTQADINHPTIGTADRGYEDYGIFVKMSDILVVDPYPITGKETDDFAKSGRAVRIARENFPNRPVYLTLQGFHYAERGDLRSPTFTELRNMAWQAICEGAEGFDCYSYPAMTSDAGKSLEQWKTEIKAIYDEVESYEAVITSDEPAPSYHVSGGGDWLNLRVERYNGKNYIFAANNTNQAQSATLYIDGAEEMELKFDALSVILKEQETENYLSHESELKTIGFSNGNEIFAVAEGEENILYVPEDAGVINYCATVSDGATFYIGDKEMPLNGKITVRIADRFTVRVVAADGMTKTTKVFRIVKG